VTLATTFNEDLALESIEFVALAELLQQRYGSAVDLIAFLAEKDMEEILAMTVGDLVSHIAGTPAPAAVVATAPPVATAPAG
jgi:acyl carrier protein